jgi:glutathione S-transferase
LLDCIDLPYGKLPVLEVDGKFTISQSTVIGRFLAKRFGLYGKNEMEEVLIDEIVDALMDFQRGN